jgi:predicted nucleic acid-binding protein
MITPEVRSEFGEETPSWVQVVPVSDQSKTKLIQNTLDLGESSSIALAMETEESILILDDGKARRYAKNIGLTLTGTIGIIVKSIQSGLLSEDIATILAELRQRGFRIPPEIEETLREKK